MSLVHSLPHHKMEAAGSGAIRAGSGAEMMEIIRGNEVSAGVAPGIHVRLAKISGEGCILIGSRDGVRVEWDGVLDKSAAPARRGQQPRGVHPPLIKE